jgi:hypothetical protein
MRTIEISAERRQHVQIVFLVQNPVEEALCTDNNEYVDFTNPLLKMHFHSLDYLGEDAGNPE